MKSKISQLEASAKLQQTTRVSEYSLEQPKLQKLKQSIKAAFSIKEVTLNLTKKKGSIMREVSSQNYLSQGNSNKRVAGPTPRTLPHTNNTSFEDHYQTYRHDSSEPIIIQTSKGPKKGQRPQPSPSQQKEKYTFGKKNASTLSVSSKFTRQASPLQKGMNS